MKNRRIVKLVILIILGTIFLVVSLNIKLNTPSIIARSVTGMYYAGVEVNEKEESLRNKLQDVFSGAANTPVRGEQNIFFIESSCTVRGTKTAAFMNGRQGCAVESAALANPNATVYFMYTCLSDKDFDELGPTDNRVLREVIKYPNVKTYHLTLDSYLTNTPLAKRKRLNNLKDSKFPVEHSSDVLRLITLWKFGGIYLDLDFVILRSLSGLKREFLVVQFDRINNAVMGFSANGIGHEVVEEFLEDMSAHYDAQKWDYNGPDLITRGMKRICNGAAVKDMTPEKCKGITVYPHKVFYPFYYNKWRIFFDENATASTMARIMNNDTYGVHLWNKLSRNALVKTGSKQPYARLAERFCPRVYSVVGETF